MDGGIEQNPAYRTVRALRLVVPSGEGLSRSRRKLWDESGRQLEGIGRLLDGVDASILNLGLVGFALSLRLSHGYDLLPGAPTSGVVPSNNPAHQQIYQTRVMIDPIL